MTTRAHVQPDFTIDGVKVALIREHSGGHRTLLTWTPDVKPIDPDARGSLEDDRASWLRLSDDDARALYEALANHYGHAGHDIRALRRDHDAERARVDRLIGALIRDPRAVQ